MNATETIALNNLVATAAAKAAREALEVGTHQVDITVRVTGSLNVAKDTEKTPTVSIPVKEVLALFVARSGCTREASLKLLRECLTDALAEGTKGEGAIAGAVDLDAEFTAMCEWIVDNCGADTPLHVSKFFPQYKLRSVPPTPNDTLKRLRKLAYQSGLRYVYLGNMPGDPGESSYCPKCGVKMISRVGKDVKFVEFDPQRGICTKCGLQIPGVWT